MAIPADLAVYSNILKTLYPQDSVPEMMYSDSPLFGLLPKDESWSGEEYALSNRYAAVTGVAHDFEAAQDNKGAPAWARFRLTDTQDYGLFSVPGRVLRATKDDKGALVRAMKASGDATFYKLRRRISMELYGNGGAARGVIASGQGTANLQLETVEDVKNFEVGDVLVSSSTDGTSGSVSVNTGTIGAINRNTGVLTVDTGVWHADFGNGDFLFIEGDFGAGLAGLDGWFPMTDPTPGDDWFGFDRSVDPQRQAGLRYTASALTDGTIEKLLVNFGVALNRVGARPGHMFMNPTLWGRLVNELGAKAVYERQQAQGSKGAIATIGYDAIKLMLPVGSVSILSDIDCRAERVYALKMSTMILASRGTMPGWLDDDGMKVLRETNADAIEGRIGWYANLGCENPGQNGVADVSALL